VKQKFLLPYEKIPFFFHPAGSRSNKKRRSGRRFSNIPTLLLLDVTRKGEKKNKCMTLSQQHHQLQPEQQQQHQSL
jgi:hypothetical protein